MSENTETKDNTSIEYSNAKSEPKSSAMLQGLAFMAVNSPKLALEAFQKSLTESSNDIDLGISNYLIELCNVMESSSDLSYVEALEHISKAKVTLEKMKEKLPPELNNMIELFTYMIEISVVSIEAGESSNNYEYDIASEKYMELTEKSEKILSLNAVFDPSTKKYFEGTREMYHGMSDLSSAEYQSESTLYENAINLCREAKQRFMLASEKFAFSQHPMAKSSSKKCLQVANTIIPKIISRYKIKSLKEADYRRVLSERDHYKKIIENVAGKSGTTNISVDQAIKNIQENNIIVQNVESELKKNLNDILRCKTNSPNLLDLQRSISPILEENGRTFLDHVKSLRSTFETLAEGLETTAPVFVPAIMKILHYINIIP